MYFISDKTAAVRALQKMLGVPETGRIDRGMAEKIEKITGSPFTGVVSYTDFPVIKKAYRKRKAARLVRDALGIDASGSNGGRYTRDEMEKINQLLAKCIKENRLEAYPPRGRFYTSLTATAVREVRKMLMLPEGDEIDVELLYRLMLNLRVKEKYNYTLN